MLPSPVPPCFGVWVGGRHADALGVPWIAIVDCCNEFPRTVFGARSSEVEYLSVPMWDATLCGPHELQEAAAFLLRNRRRGPVLVHCASGKGRSVCIAIAVLILAGQCQTLLEAQELLLSKRRVSKVLNNPLMRLQLTRWENIFRERCKASAS
eukprot:EG_transcript_21581